ncbi:family with sequence similarity 213, member [Seminavis robusta]|uniref:Peroxiredoxin-like 2A n=1 Tax=Seminavis robusta TaxID=568900 RepID=A0A9N8HD68_9STRA|nr:family with sequence similarity 213, member [Seminavis robusta]|eukprot:Sro445_g144570.1 family with sequence similarity 213, member (251) ;mRNA; f:48211-48963
MSTPPQTHFDQNQLPAELKNVTMRKSVTSSITSTSTYESTQDESSLVNTTELYKIPLFRINPSFGIVNVANKDIKLQPMTIKERRDVGANVNIVFAVRTPGCGGCREHAVQLAELAKTDKKISVVAAVKETGVDDEALMEFYEDYFHHPIYKDAEWKIFRAMGGKKVSPFTILKRGASLFRRTKTKGIESKVTSGVDFWTKGGVLIFNRKGELKYTQYERFGKEFDMEAIRDAIQDIRAEQKHTGHSQHM